MADIVLSTTNATTGSGPKASCIGWIDWDNFSLNSNETASIKVNLSDGFVMTFDVENQPSFGDEITFLSDIIIQNSAFSSLGYTGINGKVALEPFSAYAPSAYDSANFKITNISVKNSLNTSILGYSIVLASIQYYSKVNFETPISDKQVFSTDGTNWNQIAWLGPTSSPVVNDTDKNNIVLTTTSINSGSLVYSSNAPSNVNITVYSNSSLPQFAIGIAISSVALRKFVNGRLSPEDQFDLSINGIESGSVITEGTNNGLQSKYVYLNGPVNTSYTINEAMSIGSYNPLSKYDNLVTWVNNSADGTPAPKTGYLGQSVFVDIGDKFEATISNTPNVTTVIADPNSGTDADKISWIEWQDVVLTENSTAGVQASISPELTLQFELTNNSFATLTSVPITDSTFGSEIYTGLAGQCCLEATFNTPEVNLVINNINLAHPPSSDIYYKYSIILASVQYSSNAPENYEIVQEFITNGSPWQLLESSGSPLSPQVQFSSNNRVVTITTTNAVSGSPVFISDPPRTIEINLKAPPEAVGKTHTTRFSISTTIEEIPLPSRGINLFNFED